MKHINKYTMVAFVLLILIFSIIGVVSLIKDDNNVLEIVGYYDEDGNEIKVNWWNSLFQQSMISVEGGEYAEGVTYIALRVQAENTDTVPLDFSINSYGVSGGSTDNALLIETFAAGDNINKVNIAPGDTVTWLSGIGVNGLHVGTYEELGDVLLSVGVLAESSDLDLRDPVIIAGGLTINVLPNPVSAFSISFVSSLSENNLVSWWKLDNDLVIQQDAVGDNDGVVFGATATTGHINGAYSFDGENDYIDFGNDDSLQLSDKLTLDLWINPRENQEHCYDGLKGNYGVAGMMNSVDETVTWGWQLRYGSNDEDCSLGLQLNTLSGNKWVTLGENIDANTWSHVTAIFDGGTLKIYLNGVLKDTSVFATTSIITNNNNKLFLGNAGWGLYNTYFNGSIDEFKILV